MERETFPLDDAPQLVRDFVNVLKPITEAPDEYIAMGALFAGGLLAGRWVGFAEHAAMNNYFLAVGGTGSARKTTAQRFVNKMLTAVFERNPQITASFEGRDESDPKIITSAYNLVTHFSVEGLQKHALKDGTSTGLFIGEYDTVFSIGKRSGQQNTISELTNMFDGLPLRTVLASRESSSRNYCLSMYASSTPDWLAEFVSPSNIGGGLVNRHIVVTAKPERIIPDPGEPDPLDWSRIIASYGQLIPRDLSCTLDEKGDPQWSGTIRKLEWATDALDCWNAYYQIRTKEERGLMTTALGKISARENSHATKLAGLSCFLDGRHHVSIKDLRFGMRLARFSTQNLILLSGLEPQFTGEKARIMRALKTGALTKTALSHRLGGAQALINKALLALEGDGHIDLINGSYQIAETNSQQLEIARLFGKTKTSMFEEKTELGVGGQPSVKSEPNPFKMPEV